MPTSNSFLKGKWVAYAFFALAVAAVVLFSFAIINEQVLVFVLAFTGFGSIAGLRAYVDSAGIKTYLLAGTSVPVLCLILFKVITLDLGIKILGIIFGLCGITLTKGVEKATEK